MTTPDDRQVELELLAAESRRLAQELVDQQQAAEEAQRARDLQDQANRTAEAEARRIVEGG